MLLSTPQLWVSGPHWSQYPGSTQNNIRKHGGQNRELCRGARVPGGGQCSVPQNKSSGGAASQGSSQTESPYHANSCRMAEGRVQRLCLEELLLLYQQEAEKSFWQLSLGKSKFISRTSVQQKGTPWSQIRLFSVLAVRRAVWE